MGRIQRRGMHASRRQSADDLCNLVARVGRSHRSNNEDRLNWARHHVFPKGVLRLGMRSWVSHWCHLAIPRLGCVAAWSEAHRQIWKPLNGFGRRRYRKLLTQPRASRWWRELARPIHEFLRGRADRLIRATWLTRVVVCRVLRSYRAAENELCRAITFMLWRICFHR